jgi:deoxycytidine triphosphate deaminase
VGVLGREAISERLVTPNVEQQIFKSGSWQLDRVRGAAYDLRVASDYLILPDGRRFWPGASESINRAWPTEFELKPGQVAFVSSVERLSMPWDLAGNIAPKFRLALGGLFVMGGMLVDPGYGRVSRDGTDGQDEDGERLHFQLANLGDKAFTIVPDETSIAAIQFIELTGSSRNLAATVPPQSPSADDVPTSDRLLRRLFHPHANEPLPQLQFFSNVSNVESDVGRLGKRVETQEIKFQASEASIDRIIIFGLFLVFATILGAALASFF